MFIAILQARMGSSRLPNKILRKIKGKTLLELYIIPEIWQGHKNSGEGFWNVLERLENLLK